MELIGFADLLHMACEESRLMQGFCCEQLKGYSCHLAKGECRRGRCGERKSIVVLSFQTSLELVCKFI